MSIATSLFLCSEPSCIVEQASFPTLALEERDDSRIVNVVPTFALDNNSDQDWAQNTVLA
ncbi:hypothetical protein ACT691_11460 [Vibrio metschnikovii]